jgi:hypothetical protein
MTDLSPAAHAVLTAFRAVPDLRDCPSIAAALRAAAEKCYFIDDDGCEMVGVDQLLAIAAELEGSND